jgi:hypothetical protein
MQKSLIRGLVAGTVLAVTLGASAAQAQSVYNNLNSIQKSLESRYGDVEREETDDGAPRFMVSADGINTSITLIESLTTPGEYISATFFSYWGDGHGVTLTEVNDFNEDNRFIRAAIDDDGDFAIWMDVTLIGASKANFEDWLGIWDMMAGNAGDITD